MLLWQRQMLDALHVADAEPGSAELIRTGVEVAALALADRWTRYGDDAAAPGRRCAGTDGDGVAPTLLRSISHAKHLPDASRRTKLSAATKKEATVIPEPSRVLLDAISRLSRVQREIGERMSRELDCPRAALGVLWLLEKRGELTIGDLATQLRVDISVASRQASALVEAGYAERTRQSAPGSDRRVRTVQLSDAGRAFNEQARVQLNALMAEIFNEWAPEQIQAAAVHINRLADTLSAIGAHPAAEPDGSAPEPELASV